jgi:S1-C subfamily serine protease
MRISFLCLILTATSYGISADVPVETIDRMAQSIVPIMCVRLNDKKEVRVRHTLGTGFFINHDGDVLTAGHVATALQRHTTEANSCIGAVYFPMAQWKNRYSGDDTALTLIGIKECYSDERTDIGLCKLKASPFTVSKFIQVAPLATYTKFSDGSAVAFTGFPLQSIFPITSKGYIASYDPNTKKLIVDKLAWKGASGSPLYTPDGKVIGIIIETGTDQSIGLTWARPTDFAVDLMREHIFTKK